MLKEDGTAIRVMLADDHELVRRGLRAVLEEAGLDVVGDADGGEAALAMARELVPDILLLDMRMPDLDGIEVCRRLTKELPQVKVVILSSFSDDDDVFGALDAGASSYIMKDVSPDGLVGAVRAVAKGQTVLDGVVAQRVLGGTRPTAAEPASSLSAREREVLELMSLGLTNRQIAGKLWISGPTVKTHVSHILEKLGQPDRTHAILHAMALGLVAAPAPGASAADA
jgi:NarL family two-component system response regulator LiaR